MTASDRLRNLLEQATPRPWSLRDAGVAVPTLRQLPVGANAELIVAAVNELHRLLAIEEAARELMQTEALRREAALPDDIASRPVARLRAALAAGSEKDKT